MTNHNNITGLIGEIANVNSKLAYQYLKCGSFYDSENGYVVYFDVVNIDKNAYSKSTIRVTDVEYVGV